MIEKIKFDHQHIKCDNFKSRHAAIILSTIGGSRLNDYLKFKAYANISFDKDDIHCEEPIISYFEQFHRTKTNCLVFDIFDPEKYFDSDKFNRLYIYHTVSKRGNGFFGFVVCNTDTKEQWHKYFIDNTEDELCRQIWKTLWLTTDNAKKTYGEFI